MKPDKYEKEETKVEKKGLSESQAHAAMKKKGINPGAYEKAETKLSKKGMPEKKAHKALKNKKYERASSFASHISKR